MACNPLRSLSFVENKGHESLYEDAVDLVGTVLMARVNRPGVAFELEGDRTVEAVFPTDDEEKILQTLREHTQAKVRIVGRGVYDASGRLERVSQIDRVDLLPREDVEFVPSARPIWEEFDEILSDVPPDELKCLPSDAAEKHDQYLYGRLKDER
jgi:hypothetical protein